MKRKVIAAMVASALIVACFSGCNDNTESTPNQPSSSSSSQANGSSSKPADSSSSSTESSSSSSSSSSSGSDSSSSSNPGSSSSKLASSSSKPASSSSKPQSSSKPVASSSKPVTSSSKPAEKKWKDTKFVYAVEFTINTNGVNARSKPFADAASIKVYNKGEKVYCDAQTDNGYYRLKNGGYVQIKYLTGESYTSVKPSSSSSQPQESEPPYNPDGTVNRKYYSSNLIETKRPVPDDAPLDVLEKLYQGNYQKGSTRESVVRDSWDLDIGDTTFQGYKIIGKTPEGFGYIAETEKSYKTGAYIAGYTDKGKQILVYDYEVFHKQFEHTIIV